MKALLDTNFLMIPGEFKVDILSELLGLGYTEIFTIDLVIIELKKLAVSKGRGGRNARIGLEFIRKGEVVVLKARSERADEEILRLAKTGEYVVCTQDRELKKWLMDSGLNFVTLRQGRYLVESKE